jgi:hypothetical protein
MTTRLCYQPYRRLRATLEPIFQILSKDKAVSVYGRDDDLPHPIGLINWVRASSTALHQLGAEPIDVIDVQIAEQVVGTKIGGRLIARQYPSITRTPSRSTSRQSVASSQLT